MKHKVLLVDDDRNLLEGLRRALRKEPYEIRTAESADAALHILDTEPVSVVVSDQDMPNMTGTELLAKVRERYPDTIRFMLTGKATLDVAIKAINDGAISRFLTKPCNHVDLAVTIRQALQQKELMEEATRLLRVSKRQSAVLEGLEQESPGITKVEKDRNGRIVLDEAAPDYDDLIREISSQAAHAERQMENVTDWQTP